jgi:hypothetical protein
MSETKNFHLDLLQPPSNLVQRPSHTMNLDPVCWLSLQLPVSTSASRPPGAPQLVATRPNSLSSTTSGDATYTDLTPSHKPLPIPPVQKGLGDVLEPMSMCGATQGIIDMWDRLLEDHTKAVGDCLCATDYAVVGAASPYLKRPYQPRCLIRR